MFEHIDKKSIQITEDDKIELNRHYSRTMSEIQKELKSGKCFVCGKDVTSYCNSHMVPKFCLDNIGIEGEVATPNRIIQIPGMGKLGKERLGINSAGTFQMICRECDSKIFQEYENPDNYSEGKYPTQKMLSQIAMKNYLKFINKRKIEILLAEKALKKLRETKKQISSFLEVEEEKRLKVSKTDLQEYIKEFKTAQKNSKSKIGNGYYIIHYELLDYVVPIAVQAPLSIYFDIEGNVINDMLNNDPTYRFIDLHLCIFPLSNKTAVLLFVENNSKRYKNFYKQLRKLPHEDQLAVINYIIFLYSEDYFLNKNVEQTVDLSDFKDKASLTPVFWNFCMEDPSKEMKNEYTLQNYKNIPNLLSEKYKIR